VNPWLKSLAPRDLRALHRAVGLHRRNDGAHSRRRRDRPHPLERRMDGRNRGGAHRQDRAHRRSRDPHHGRDHDEPWAGDQPAGLLLHQHIAHKRLKAADAAGYARAVAEDAKVIAAMRARAQTAEANMSRISQESRVKNDTDNRNINAAAAVIVRSGPGAASCRRVGNPAVPASSSGHVAGNSAPGPAAAPVLADNGLAAVPWDWLVNTGREADLDRAEALAWRDWYKREAAEWEKTYPP
jgi:hypothetical protein